MQHQPIQVMLLEDGGDERGSSFSLPDAWRDFLTSVVDVHITTLQPSYVRGNHYHIERRESLIVTYSDQWSLHWDYGPDSEIQHQQFAGSGTALILVEPYASHAIRNDGAAILHIIGMTNGKYDPKQPDAYGRPVI